MRKTLDDMTLEELWQLFPICLTEHQPCWAAQYAAQESALRCILPKNDLHAIHHIGSTAIPTIWAKPIVDILVEVQPDADMDALTALLGAHGWLCMSVSEGRRSLNKGYTPDGFAEEVFHLHLRVAGDHDELYFRDYLLDHPQAAKEYEALKLQLWKTFEHDRDGYTNAKHDLIARYTALAKPLYQNRYR